MFFSDLFVVILFLPKDLLDSQTNIFLSTKKLSQKLLNAVHPGQKFETKKDHKKVHPSKQAKLRVYM